MRRHIAIAVALALAGPLCAQIFPGIEREDVLKRAPGGAQEAPQEKPAAGESKIDGPAVLKRYEDLLTGYTNAKSEQKKAYSPFTDKVHDSVRKYAEAMAMLRLGYYEDAAKAFDGVGYTVKKDADIKGPPELRKVADDIKNGRALYFRMIAVVMQEYRQMNDPESELGPAWAAARKKGEAVIKDCQGLVDRKRIDQQAGTTTVRQMEGWLGTAMGQWRRMIEAENRTRQNPHEMEGWVALINATGTPASITGEVEAAWLLKRRAAARVLKKFWPAAERVVDGTADIALATSHYSAFQFDDYGQYLVAQEYHTAAGKAALDDFLAAAQKHLETLHKLKGE